MTTAFDAQLITKESREIRDKGLGPAVPDSHSDTSLQGSEEEEGDETDGNTSDHDDSPNGDGPSNGSQGYAHILDGAPTDPLTLCNGGPVPI